MPLSTEGRFCDILTAGNLYDCASFLASHQSFDEDSKILILFADTKRAISILEGILADLQARGGVAGSYDLLDTPDDGNPAASSQDPPTEHAQKNLMHMLNVQGMLDRLQSPLFNSLQEIQSTQQEVRESDHPLGRKGGEGR